MSGISTAPFGATVSWLDGKTANSVYATAPERDATLAATMGSEPQRGILVQRVQPRLFGGDKVEQMNPLVKLDTPLGRAGDSLIERVRALHASLPDAGGANGTLFVSDQATIAAESASRVSAASLMRPGKVVFSLQDTLSGGVRHAVFDMKAGNTGAAQALEQAMALVRSLPKVR